MCCHTQSTEMKPLGLAKESERMAKFLILHTGTSVNAEYKRPTSGYMVSIAAGPVYHFSEPVPFGELVQFVEGNPLDNETTFYGSWLDKETGKIYIDLAANLRSKDFALALAKDLKEIAIWDVINNCEIRLDYSK